jgi:hypothetical protein
MTQSPKVLDDQALDALPTLLNEWRAHPYSEDLRTALAKHCVPDCGHWTIATMLCPEDGEVALERAFDSGEGETRRIFDWLWYSGLFADACKLLDSSPQLRKAVGLGRRPMPDHERFGPPVYDDDTIVRFETSIQAARLGLWGESRVARELRSAVVRAAKDTRKLGLEILNVGLGGPSGSGKGLVVGAIHRLARRGPIAALSPEDGEADTALAAVMAGGTLYLRRADHLQKGVRSSVYSAMTSGVYRDSKMDTLLIVDSPITMGTGYGLGENIGARNSFLGALGRNVPGTWSMFTVPDLKRRKKDLPLLVKRILLVIDAAELLDVRHHFARWLMEQMPKSGADLDVGWLVHATREAYQLVRPDWAPPNFAERYPKGRTQPARSAEENEFRRVSAGWKVTYGGEPMTILTSRKGMRAIAHLLSVYNPRRCAEEVRQVMDGQVVAGSTTDVLFQEDGHEFGQLRDQEILDDQAMAEYKQKLKALDRKSKELNVKLGAPSMTEEELDLLAEEDRKLAEERAAIKKELSRLVDIHGESRTWGQSKDSQIVGKEIYRALKSILAQAERATKEGEEGVLCALHKHLSISIKDKFNDKVRYDSSVQWKVAM